MEYRFAYKFYRLPMATPLRTAHGPWAVREGLILRLEGEDGSVGFGEVAPIAWFGTETLAEAAQVCLQLGDRPDERLLDSVPAHCGCVRFALAAARAQIAGGEAAATGAARLPVAALLPAGKAVLPALARALEAGHLAFKWKVGVSRPDEELPLLDDLISAMPGYAKLRLDANGAWDRRQAQRWLQHCAERPVEFVEQPLEPGDEDGLLGLARDFPVTLALDEAVTGLAQARRWQGQGWPGLFVIKPVLAGPLGEIEAWIRETKADVVLSSAIETVIGRAAALRWAVRSGVTKRAVGFGVGPVFADAAWNGPALGALADDRWAANLNAEALWSALA